MKIDRLLAITVLLLNRRRMTARDLSDRFEVSVRTVYRDVETLNRSGIPVVTFQGQGGGLCIPDHYKLSRQLLTFSDMVSILTTLRGVNQALNDKAVSRAVEKIASLIPHEREGQYKAHAERFLVDLTPWDASCRNRDTLALVQEGVTRSRCLAFTYAKPGGSPEARVAEPYTLAFKHWSWYLLAFCRVRQDFRVFKLSRMRDLRLSPEAFTRQEILAEAYFAPSYPPSAMVEFTLRVTESLRSRMEEYVDPGKMVPEPAHPSGFRLTMTLPENGWLYSFLLGLGPDAEVLSPQALRETLAQKVRAMQKLYSNLT